jgi:hypothetical protein
MFEDALEERCRKSADPATGKSIELADNPGHTSICRWLAHARGVERERPFESAVCYPATRNVISHFVEKVHPSAEELDDHTASTSQAWRATGVNPMRLHDCRHPGRVIRSLFEEREHLVGRATDNRTRFNSHDVASSALRKHVVSRSAPHR